MADTGTKALWVPPTMIVLSQGSIQGFKLAATEEFFSSDELGMSETVHTSSGMGSGEIHDAHIPEHLGPS